VIFEKYALEYAAQHRELSESLLTLHVVAQGKIVDWGYICSDCEYRVCRQCFEVDAMKGVFCFDMGGGKLLLIKYLIQYFFLIKIIYRFDQFD